MKNVLFLLLFFNYSIAQIQSGAVYYSSYINEARATKEIEIENKALYEQYYHTDIIAKTLEFKMIFNNKMSKFYALKYMPSDEFKPIYVEIVKSYFKYDDQYYTDLEKDSVYEFAMYYNGLRELRNKTADYEWELHNETKEISGYTCYKATTIHKFYWNGKDREFPVTAWYCPQLPYRFGPLRYGGLLPGLILELSESFKTWFATKIELSSKNTNITIPQNIEEYNSQEMEKELKELKDSRN
ncbi:GLPGLI family protein [Flavobacterium sp. U410]